MSDGDVSKVVDMVEAGLPVDIVDEYDNTVRRWAAYFNQTHVVLFLFQKDVDVDKGDRDGWRVLHIASMKNSTDVIRMLQQNELIRDIKNDYGRPTMLHVAITAKKQLVYCNNIRWTLLTNHLLISYLLNSWD